MGFKGYWVNVIRQKYTTSKYPHCYVGKINNIGEPAFWGYLNKQGSPVFWGHHIKEGSPVFWGSNLKKGSPAFWGNYGGTDMVTHSFNLNETDCIYDKRSGWNMAVEKEWHVLDPVTLDGAETPLYDAELRELELNNFGIRIFYKAVVPLYCCENNGLTIDLTTQKVFDNMMTTLDVGSDDSRRQIGASFINCPLGASNYNYSYYIGVTEKLSTVIKSILSVSPEYATGAYALPADNILNATSLSKSDFATGRDILYTFDVLQRDGKNYTLVNDFNKKVFMMLGNASQNVSIDGYTASYSFDTSLPIMNLPYAASTQSYRKLLPPLFKPFGLAGNNLAEMFLSQYNPNLELINKYAIANANQFVWYYCVLGVKELSTPTA